MNAQERWKDELDAGFSATLRDIAPDWDEGTRASNAAYYAPPRALCVVRREDT